MTKIVLLTLGVLLMNGIIAKDIYYDSEKSIAIQNLMMENEEYDGAVLPSRFCSSPGTMCKNCTTTVLCIEIDDGIFEEHVADNCKDGQTCLEIECVEPSINPHCSKLMDIPFQCSNVGVFPNQLDCRKFHMCVPISGEEELKFKNYDGECSTGYKYNAKTTVCDRKLVGNRCFANISEFPVPLCLRNGAMGALKDNPSIYFICEYYKEIDDPNLTTEAGTTTTAEPEEPFLYPYLYLCPHGRIFDVEQLRCIYP